MRMKYASAQCYAIGASSWLTSKRNYDSQPVDNNNRSLNSIKRFLVKIIYLTFLIVLLKKNKLTIYTFVCIHFASEQLEIQNRGSQFNKFI